MDILILGGTRFVGRQNVLHELRVLVRIERAEQPANAAAQGHFVTQFL